MIYPMFAMVVLTIAVGLVAFVTRIKSVKQGTVDAKDYKLMNADSYPESVTKTSRSLNNQFEVPVLFYVGCLAFLALNIVSSLGLALAWVFVACRLVHAFIHITYNHLMHRIVAYWLSVLTALALWITLMLNLA